jgi:hypothetical protein
MLLTNLSRGAAALCFAAALAFGASSTTGFTTGNLQLKSAGPLAFGPDGILFIGDSVAANIVAVDTRDAKPAASAGAIDVRGINQKVAALLGVAPTDVIINDVKVNPISKNVYLSVSRGRGPDAIPVVLRLDASGKMTEVSFDNVAHSVAAIPNAPDAVPGGRNPRLDTITQMAYVDGRLLVAGLSNEEFSSNLRTIPFPFKSVASGASVEIYHGSHGRFETNSPVRTFVPYTIQNKPFIVAAYTCTPLVTIPMGELKPGVKVKGTTIAELGAGNRPLDMIAYKKDGHDYILMANSAHGVLKLTADHLETYKPILAQTEPAGVPFEHVKDLAGVKHLTSLDNSSALILSDNNGTQDLRSIPLP